MNPQTMKINSRDPEQGEFIVINAEDFNAETDVVYLDAEVAETAVKPKKTK